jgi:hypothetical protein
VAAAGKGQAVPVRLAAHYQVQIHEDLAQSLSRHQLGVYEVAWLDGILAHPGAAGAGADEGGAAAANSQATATSEESKLEQLVMELVPVGSVAAVAAAAGMAGNAAAGVAALASSGSTATPAAIAAAACAAAGAAAAEAMEINTDSDAAVTAGEQQEAVDAACGDHGGIFIGNVKLSEVKQALASVGISSEFRGGGRLVVGSSLVVRRDGAEGQLLMEGPLCEDYFRVRDVVYGLYNVC